MPAKSLARARSPERGRRQRLRAGGARRGPAAQSLCGGRAGGTGPSPGAPSRVPGGARQRAARRRAALPALPPLDGARAGHGDAAPGPRPVPLIDFN